MKIATDNNALLLTEDKDFGELVYRLKKNHCGILLIRLAEYSVEEKITLIKTTLQNYPEQLKDVFSVLDERKLRIRKQ